MFSKLFSDECQNSPRKTQILSNVSLNEEWTDYPPVKQMKFDNKNTLDTEDSYEFSSNMKKEDSIFDNEEGCKVEENPKKWTSSCTMKRQSIHTCKYNLRSTVTSDKRKLESDTGGKVVKNKPSYNRLFGTCRTSNGRDNMDRGKTSTFQSNIKKSLNFIQESYRLSEKLQYMQLIQQHTTKANSIFNPFTIHQIWSQKGRKSSVPVIDLTKEKINVVVDRSRENIPRTSSQTKSSDDLASLNINLKEVPQTNSLQEILKTHLVTDRNIVDEILSHYSSEAAEILKQAEIEKAKVEALSESNRKAYNESLEKKLQDYMHITSPALEEIEPEEEQYVLPELTKEQESKISTLLVPSPAGEVLVEKFGLQIKRRDLQTLKGLNWLNDEVINFYMNLIMERSNQRHMPKVYAFNTFFYPKLLSGGHASLKRWTKKVDIFSHDMVLVPVHLGMHWCMSVIDFRSKEVRYYDSMGSPNNRCLQALLSYLEAESLDKKKVVYSTNDWEQINVEDIPQQMNGSDCGVFSCVFAEHLSRDSPLLFTQENMPYFRKKMVIEIFEGKLLT